ncbi:MAG TPA: DUF418 domain-containing protein, partial [Sphingomonadaceae bacterium]|nr:DUF418 domain-containing protein [Sphingomonadaceae bacterium]
MDAGTSPTAPSDRIASLDVLRGVAVMGIFAMNIVNFAMPDAAQSNPAAFGHDGPADLLAWLAAFVAVEGKMRGLFSFLFGASLLLVVTRAQQAGEPGQRVHFARMGWLLALGAAHAVLVWDGDILVQYALVGMLAFGFRQLFPQELAVAVALLLAVQLLAVAGLGAALGATGSAGAYAAPAPAALAADLALHRGPYAALVAHRLGDLVPDNLINLAFYGCETLAYMLAGMWGLKTGFLTGAWTPGRYRRVAALCLGLTIPAYAALGLAYWTGGFDTDAAFAVTTVIPTVLRPIMVVGLAAFIVLTAGGGALTARIA